MRKKNLNSTDNFKLPALPEYVTDMLNFTYFIFNIFICSIINESSAASVYIRFGIENEHN